MASDSTENRLYDDQVADYGIPMFQNMDQLVDGQEKRAPYTGPFLRFGRSGNSFPRSLRNVSQSRC